MGQHTRVESDWHAENTQSVKWTGQNRCNKANGHGRVRRCCRVRRRKETSLAPNSIPVTSRANGENQNVILPVNNVAALFLLFTITVRTRRFDGNTGGSGKHIVEILLNILTANKPPPPAGVSWKKQNCLPRLQETLELLHSHDKPCLMYHETVEWS